MSILNEEAHLWRGVVARRSGLRLSLLAVVLGIGASGLFAILSGSNPLEAYRLLLTAAFGCAAPGRCALLTTLQFATPLLLTGLSAAVALRSGVFSLGQAGQMLLGAAAAGWVGARLEAPPAAGLVAALAAGMLLGAGYGLIPGALKAWIGVNEIIVTLVMNQLAFLLVGGIGFRRVLPALRLAPLAPGTKLNAGALFALLAAAAVYLWFTRRAAGYEQQMQAQAPEFARYGGVSRSQAILRAMLASGALAGLAGAIEVLGVHYRLVGAFSGGGGFDGLAVAVLGQLHPFGVALASIMLAGVRVGALNGLQLRADIPRELGGVMIAVILLLAGAELLLDRLRPASSPPIEESGLEAA